MQYILFNICNIAHNKIYLCNTFYAIYTNLKYLCNIIISTKGNKNKKEQTFVIRECLVPFEQMRSENKARDSEMYDYRTE